MACLGETKTEVVRAMPGYATRRHREFVAYYDVIAAAPANAGLLATPHAGATVGATRIADDHA